VNGVAIWQGSTVVMNISDDPLRHLPTKILESVVCIISWTTHNLGPELTRDIPFYIHTPSPQPHSLNKSIFTN